MQENEFEKQVKELMEQFNISPSAPVWEKIKERVTKKKRRVLPVFFLLAAIVFSSGYFFYTDVKNEGAKSKAKSEEQKLQNKGSKNLQAESAKPKTNNDEQIIKKKSNEKNVVVINEHERNYKIASAQQQFVFNNDNKITDTAVNKHDANNIQTEKQNTNIIQQQNNSQNISDSITKNTEALTKLNETTSNSNNTHIELSNKKPAKINKDKWRFGITAMYGKSDITNTLLNLNKEKSLQTNVNFATGNNNAGIENPFYTNDGYSFGITVQRKISKQSFINTGINFIHLSSKSNAALGIDSFLVAVAANFQTSSLTYNFYRIGTAKTYASTFNFIEIPINFQSNLLHVKNFAVLYNAGLSIRHIVSSNALIYNSKHNSFFSDDDLLRKTQFQLNAGLNLQWHTKETGDFLLGPQLQYSLSTYLKNTDYNRMHYANYGLQATWLFNKNKL